MEKAQLTRTSRINAGHLWVFSNELAGSPKKYAPGELVELTDKKGNFLGIGYANPHSLIAVRILTREKEEIDEAFFRRRVLGAIGYRNRFIGEDRTAYRAVYSESDGLPGLIVDRYGATLAVQMLTAGMEALKGPVIRALEGVFSPEAIVLRNDSPSRTLEGLPLEKKVLKGPLEKNQVIKEGGLLFEVDPLSGQKTGFFLDQVENRMAFAGLCERGEALDLFSYTGAWAVRLAQRGASVIGVDASEGAVTQARRNAELNGLSDKCAFIKADVLEYLKGEASGGKKYDYIVLDPPAFVKSKNRVKEALRAYREINASVMKLLKKGGLLATSSCSYHVSREMFLDMLRDAARDSGRTCRVVEARSQGRDHPISLHVPETEYLKCVIMEVL